MERKFDFECVLFDHDTRKCAKPRRLNESTSLGISGRVSSRSREARPGGFAVGPRCWFQQDLRHPAGAGRVVSRHGRTVCGASAMQLHRGARLPERGGVPPVGRQSPVSRAVEGGLRAPGRRRSGGGRVPADRRNPPPPISEGIAAAGCTIHPRRQIAQHSHP